MASDLNRFDRLFVVTSLLIQLALVVFFALRKWNYPVAMQVGWIVYALAVPAVAVTVRLIRAGRPWYLWPAGMLFAAWAVFGIWVDVISPVEWRSPMLMSVFPPCVILYTRPVTNSFRTLLATTIRP